MEATVQPGDLGTSIDSHNDRSLEETDHLVRNTKKIKNTTKSTEDQAMIDSIQATTEEQTLRSFKQALISTKANEKAFDIDLDRFSKDEFLTDEEDNKVMEEAAQSLNNDLGPIIPKIKLLSRLIQSIRRPWKDCLIVRLLGKIIGYKLLVSKLKRIWGLQEYCSSKPSPVPVKATSEGTPNGNEAGSYPSLTVSSSGKQSTVSREQPDEFGPWMLVNRRNNRPHSLARQNGPNYTNSKRPANRFGPLAASGSMGGSRDKAKAKSPMDPDMNVAPSHAPSFEAGNPTAVNQIFSASQQDERQPIQDKTIDSKGHDSPGTSATSSPSSLVQTTCEAPSLIVTETSPPHPSSSPFDPIPVQIPAFHTPHPPTDSTNTSTATFDLKQKPPDIHNEHLQPLQHQRGLRDSSSSNYQDKAQLVHQEMLCYGIVGALATKSSEETFENLLDFIIRML
ncbi:hypothetical protein LOK49_LG12G00223 [Camellia lanceoleosa]|uniref:Uncharacterized protein n=1 Tax=Camellia lanceoleosa TaxID=1840588 RepID=A0ACC0FN13_9ERIC|nr:hypothetical protein LOK49_LG12G00223 [Camellia lanceoleosa]